MMFMLMMMYWWWCWWCHVVVDNHTYAESSIRIAYVFTRGSLEAHSPQWNPTTKWLIYIQWSWPRSSHFKKGLKRSWFLYYPVIIQWLSSDSITIIQWLDNYYPVIIQWPTAFIHFDGLKQPHAHMRWPDKYNKFDCSFIYPWGSCLFIIKNYPLKWKFDFCFLFLEYFFYLDCWFSYERQM